MIKHAFSTITLFLLTSMACAQEETGHPIIGEYPNVEVYDHLVSYSEYKVALGPLSDAGELGKALDLEGKITRTIYQTQDGESLLKVYRNFKSAMDRAGFEILFECKEIECNGDIVTVLSADAKANAREAGVLNKRWLPRVSFGNKEEDEIYPGRERTGHYMAAVAEINGKKIYAVYQITANLYSPSGNGINFTQEIIELEGPQDDLVATDINFDNDIALYGKVSLDGLFFDSGKSTLTAESEPALNKITEYLKSNADQSFYVVGHTDSDGSYEANVDLSKQRAQQVVKNLISKGITEEQLIPLGVGPVSPNKSNVSEEGKLQNRRVELVER